METASFAMLMGTGGVNDSNYIRGKGTGALYLGTNDSDDLTIANGGAISTVGNLTVGSGLTVSSTSTLNGVVSGTGVQTVSTSPGANQLLKTNSSGYTYTGWINTVSGATTSTPARIYCSQDAFIRYMTLANFRTNVADQTKFCAPATRVFNYSGTRNVNGQYSFTFPSTIGGVSLSGAKAIIVNLAVRSAGNSYFVAWKYGTTLPGIALVNLVPNVFGNVQATIPMDTSRRIRYMYGAAAGNYTIFDVIGVVF